MTDVFVLGGYQTDFARHIAREGKEVADLVGEAVDGALAAAGVSAEDVGQIHVGNAFGELFSGQAQMGALPATVRPALWGVPATRHEAACASGSVAVLAAMAAIRAGLCECALVVGVEQERNVPGDTAARYLGTAAWTGHEGSEAAAARFLWPHMFARLADVVGVKEAHLDAISRKNFANAKRNDKAQTRGWTFDASADNPIVEGRLRRSDCAQITDGAAAVVLGSARFARGRNVPRVLGWGHRTAGLSLDSKLARSADGYLLPHVRDAALEAYRRAGIAGVAALDAIEVHDCFTITEYLLLDHLGITPPGRAWEAIDDGSIERGGRIPVNPSGGLIGGGHPVGATGVRMVADAARMVAEGAGRVGTLNIGGSATTVVSFVIGG